MSGLSQQELNARYREKKRVVSVAKPQDAGRRKELEQAPDQWLMYYLPGTYPKPFGKYHLDIIDAVWITVRNGTNLEVLAARGGGKSTLISGCVFMLSITGETLFPVYIPWSGRDLRRCLNLWKTALCFTPRLAADYPEVCAPFVHSRGISLRLLSAKGADGESTGAELRLSDGIIVLPNSFGVMGSATINGNPRGLNYTTQNGTVLRPSVAFIDDPQDKATAKSLSQTEAVIDIIDTDVAGMAGPQARMPMLMAATILRRGDVPSHYKERKDWTHLSIPQVASWPSDMSAWNEVRDALLDKREPDAVELYLADKERLTQGMAVSWEHRFDASRGEPDAYYSAMRDFFVKGETFFMAERQNEPLESTMTQYEITPKMICAHTLDLPRIHLPEWAQTFVGMVDINRAGLHWCLAGFDNKMTAHVPAYGKWPDGGELWSRNAPELERKQAIFRGLKELTARIAQTSFVRAGVFVKPSLLLIDRGYEPDVVHKFCTGASHPFQVMPSRGYAAHKYWPRPAMTVGKPMEGCHVTRGESGHFVSFNADMWRETSQRAFLADAGAHGGCTLWKPDHAGAHMNFAEQVSAEKLANKYQTDGGLRWEWVKAVGATNDYGDALTGCYVAAAVKGLSASGEGSAERKRPKARVVISRR